MSSSYIICINVLFLDSAVAKSQTVSYLKFLPITKGTTNEKSSIPTSNTTIWTQTQSASNVFIKVSYLISLI